MKKTIGLFLISTGNYSVFLQPYIDSLRNHFFKEDRVIIYLFFDKPTYRFLLPSRFSLICIPTPTLPFPYPTLYRYKWICSIEKEVQVCDYLFYSDVDMKMVGDVGNEILPDETTEDGIVATRHPGFYNGGGAFCDDQRSNAYTLPSNRGAYFAGGFQGGATKKYMEAVKYMNDGIEDDSKKNVMATWHDEGHWNHYLSTRKHKTLTPEYCMIEQIDQRAVYGITHLVPKLIALKKDHEKIRTLENMPMQEKNEEELTEAELHDKKREEWLRSGNM